MKYVVIVIVGGFILFILSSIIANARFRRKHPEQYAELEAERRKREDYDIYNGYKDECPNCGSNKVRRLESSKQAMKMTVMGDWSITRTSEFICDDCGHKWK